MATYAAWVHIAYGTGLYDITSDGRGAVAVALCLLGIGAALATFASRMVARRGLLMSATGCTDRAVPAAVVRTAAEPHGD